MKQTPHKKVNIFLSLDKDILPGYFNQQDPAPLYKRQLSHEFEQYIMTTIRSANRQTHFNYRISYRCDEEKQYADPLVFAIRRHFAESKAIAIATFTKFKQRTYRLLFASLAVVSLIQGSLPFLLHEGNGMHAALHNSFDVLCWVILWKPIERLIFYWNPFLKDISVLNRLENAEINVMEIED
jgi:hypothetical protein